MHGAFEPKVNSVNIGAYTIPAAALESDGTYEWNETTVVVVELESDGKWGLGYSYTDVSAAQLIEQVLLKVVLRTSALSPEHAYYRMRHAVRNLGRSGLAACAISAVDAALWDLKARLLQLPLVFLLGAVRHAVPVYGSGGFTSYSPHTLERELRGWLELGIQKAKIKVGRNAEVDLERVRMAREVLGERALLMVDANGGYRTKQALEMSERFKALDVVWFEEPVSSDDLEGLHLVRQRAPAGMDIAAGEYGFEPLYFRRLLQADAVDVVQVDVTRACGVSGFLKAAALCEAHAIPLSAHCAPALHAALGCAVHGLIDLEYFIDHVRLEHLLFEGLPKLNRGMLAPDLSRTGTGLSLRRDIAKEYLSFKIDR